MYRYAFLALMALLVLSVSCSDKYKLQLNTPKTIQIDEPLSISVREKNGNPIDSVQYFINGKPVESNEELNISDYRLGKQAISATIYFDGEKRQLNNTVYFLAADPPKVYGYEIVNEFPHDDKAFTQGFVFHNGYFYESTGQRGRSSLRKTEIETGKVIRKDLKARAASESS